MTEGQNVKVIPTPDEDVPTKDFAEGREGCGKKEVSLEEAGKKEVSLEDLQERGITRPI